MIENEPQTEAVPMGALDTDALGVMVLAMLREIASRNGHSLLQEIDMMREAVAADPFDPEGEEGGGTNDGNTDEAADD